MEFENLLEIRGVSKSFPGVRALNKVNLELRRGEIHLLLGENGAGKSTLIKTIVGINKADEGEIYWEGKLANFRGVNDAYNAGIAVIYQELSNVPNLSVTENMFVGNEITKYGFVNWHEQRTKAREKLSIVGLDGLDINLPMSSLGVGQKQLVEIAKALSRDAKLLIMDEPTSSLSYHEIENLLELMKKLKSEGITILFITHKLDEAEKVGDRVTVLRDGENSGETIYLSDTSQDEIIEMMVGRSIKEKYPKRDVELGEVCFKCSNLSGVRFHNISFDLRKGELLGIFGLVGAGRTELVRAIFGADPVLGGDLYLDGKTLNIKSIRDAINSGIVLVSENRREEGLILIHDVIKNSTVVDFSDYKSQVGLIEDKKCYSAVEGVANMLQLRPMHLERETRLFSGGNQQKIVVMKWLLAKGRIIIFDEPTKGVDVGAKIEIYNIINDLLSQGNSIIMVSSEIEEIIGMSDRVLTMYKGKATGLLVNDSTVREADILKRAIGEGE